MLMIKQNHMCLFKTHAVLFIVKKRFYGKMRSKWLNCKSHCQFSFTGFSKVHLYTTSDI